MKHPIGREALGYFFVRIILLVVIYGVSNHLIAQDTIKMTLQQCVEYSLQNRQLIKQSRLDQRIRENDIRINLSAWLPQIRSEYSLNHSFVMPVSLIPDFTNPAGPRIPVTIGVPNTSTILFQLDQVIFNSDVLLAAKAGRYAREEARLQTEGTEIDVVVEVSKAYYGLLLAQQQYIVTQEDILRRKKLLDDTYNQYVAGVVDKVDYKRSSISYNNSLTARKRYEEELSYRNYYLKQLMGFPMDKALIVEYDTLTMIQDAYIDTTQTPDINKRVEYRMQNAQLQLLRLNINYYKWDFLPKVGGFVNYNFYYQNEEFSKLYSKNFPNSQIGLRVSLPIFTGFRRTENLQKARRQYERLELDIDYFKAQVQTEYSLALSTYKGNLFDLSLQRENLINAREVYDLVKFQYDEGIKTYLDVTTAEVELRTTEISYLNALFNVLSSKLDVEKALGIVSW